jgi:hypothetical protein
MMRREKAPTKVKMERGSGNVYADLGFKDPERLLVKAELVAAIASIISKRGLKWFVRTSPDRLPDSARSRRPDRGEGKTALPRLGQVVGGYRLEASQRHEQSPRRPLSPRIRGQGTLLKR